MAKITWPRWHPCLYMSRLMGKLTICICENKDADQLRGNREADQRLCFRYSDSTIPLLLKSEISSFQLFSVLVQASLCRTWSETTLLVFPRGGSYCKDLLENFFGRTMTLKLSGAIRTILATLNTGGENSNDQSGTDTKREYRGHNRRD